MRILTSEEQVVHLPELPLRAGGHRSFMCEKSVRVRSCGSVFENQADVFVRAQKRSQHTGRARTREGFEISKKQDRNWGLGRLGKRTT